MSLPMRRLGSSDLRITTVGLGTWALGGGGWAYGWGPQDDTDSLAGMRRALELGVNWIETAAVYGLGRCEELVGRLLRELTPADRPYIFTKCGLVWDEHDPMKSPRKVLRPESIRAECEASLRRLGIERIDLYQFHWPDKTGTPVEDSWGEMGRLLEEGKIRAAGVANFDVELLRRCEKIRHVDSLQPPFSLIRRKAGADEIPWCAEHATGVICYSPMQSGLLTDGFTEDRVLALAPDDWRRGSREFRAPRLQRNLALRDALRPIAQRHDTTTSAIAAAWTLTWPGVTGAIVGARNPGQVDGWIAAATLELTKEDLEQIASAIVRSEAGSGPAAPAGAIARTSNSQRVRSTPSSRRPAPASETERWRVWDSFLEARPDTGFMQSSWWLDFRTHWGYEYFGITLKADNAIVGGAVVQKYSYDDHQCFYYIQDGPVLPSDASDAGDVFEAIFKAIEERRKSEPGTVSHLRIEPRWVSLPVFVSGFRPIRPLTDRYLEARDTRCIDLRPPEAAILAQMKPKGRYNIGVARRHNVSIVEDTSERGLSDFQSIYEETTNRQGFRPKAAEYFQTLVSLSAPEDRRSLFFAEYQGTRIAAALVMYFGPRATFFYGGSRDVHREVMASYLLHFEIMLRAKALGHEWYDLWGVAPADARDDHPWQNFTVFKAKFGGVEVHLVPTLDYVYDAAAYDCYGRMA